MSPIRKSGCFTPYSFAKKPFLLTTLNLKTKNFAKNIFGRSKKHKSETFNLKGIVMGFSLAASLAILQMKRSSDRYLKEQRKYDTLRARLQLRLDNIE